MASGGTDEQMSPDVITDALSDIKCQLQQLSNDSSKIHKDVQGEQGRAHRIQSNVEKLHSEMQSLSENFAGLIEKADSVRQERMSADDEYIRLLQEKIQMLEEEKFVRTQLQVQDVGRKLQEEGKNLQENEGENERMLLEFAKDDLIKKKEDLSAMERRLEEKRIEYDKEWEGFKDDVQRAKEEKRPYMRNIQEFDNLVMARFKGILRFSPQALSEKERASAELTIQNLEIKKELEGEREKLLQLELISRDYEQSTNNRLLERRSLWKQFDSFQEEKFKLQGPDDAGFVLHRTTRLENLLAEPKALTDSLVFDCGDNEGKGLHRCHKNTDVSIPFSEAERNELQSILYDGEETSEKEEQDVDITPHDIQQQMRLDQDISNQMEPSTDLGAGAGPGPSDETEAHDPEKDNDSTDDNQKPGFQLKDVAKNLLKQAEGNIDNSDSLMSKIQSRLSGLGGIARQTVDPTRTGSGTGAGSGFTFSIQRLKSDSRYKVDPAFKRQKRH
ncbi:Hypothetical predicted protein [Mytilus galloprovincialis]|uniref:Uncharacterized protein n=1 Tax=Mytilus galloprovincialis TaxID=29158 RepID=A0A8B6H6L8_MYTGA|nr:Hypothetical predicted protein [Mytilus galloprovincialis]